MLSAETKYFKALNGDEEEMAGKEYNLDKSEACVLNDNFPKINNLSFLQTVKLCEEDSKKILEIGGGNKQVAAIELLEKFPLLDYSSIELRSLSPEAVNTLKPYPNYSFFNKGVSSLPELFSNQVFDVIFAHNFVELLEEPFKLIEALYQNYLSANGLIFVNRLPVYENLWNQLLAVVKNQGIELNSKKTFNCPSSMKKAGIIYGSLVIRKNKQPLNFPISYGMPMNNYNGDHFITKEISLSEMFA